MEEMELLPKMRFKLNMRKPKMLQLFILKG